MGVAALACCGAPPPPPAGLFSSPSGLAISGNLLFISNQDADELHVYEAIPREFVPSPMVLFPLSLPTVRRPGPMCADPRQVYVASSVDPLLGILDAVQDSSSNRPATGLRELGEVALPGVASSVVCALAPEAVTAREIRLGGSPAGYHSLVSSGALVVDTPSGVLPDGGPDERHALASLPSAAIVAINRVDNPTELYEIENDPTGASCPDAGFVERCAPGAVPANCPGPTAFCPSGQPLLSLSPQPSRCNPIGPPTSRGFDIAGSGTGAYNLGEPSDDPSTANLLLAADRNSSCVAAIDLDDGALAWLPASGPTRTAVSLPYLPGTCVAAGAIFAAAFDSEQCEQRGPPPPGGYIDCNGIVFFDLSKAFSDSNPMHARLPAPLPYPFVQSLDRPLPPVRISGIVHAMAFTGPAMEVGGFSTTTASSIPLQVALIVGTDEGDFFYLDLGFGSPGGGTESVDGGYPCPPSYFAPRLVDLTDYGAGTTEPGVTGIAASDNTGAALPLPVVTEDSPLTSSGAPLAAPLIDRLGQPLVTTPAISPATGTLPAVSCYGFAAGSELCLTGGMVQHGAAENENFSVQYEGSLPGLSGQPGTLSGAQLESRAAIDFTSYLPEAPGAAGVVAAEAAQLGVDVWTAGGQFCGDYGLAAVSPSTLTLAPIGGSPIGCAQGVVTFTVFALDRPGVAGKPYTVSGSESGFIGLWPDDGTLHFVRTGRWQYPADLIAMGRSAEQLTDLVLGPVASSPAPGSSLAPPRPEDYDALDAAFGLAVKGPLGPPLPRSLDGGAVIGSAPGVTPQRGAAWLFSTTSGVEPLNVSPADTSSLIEGMASYIDTTGDRHVYGTYRGGSALIELNPVAASYAALNEVH